MAPSPLANPPPPAELPVAEAAPPVAGAASVEAPRPGAGVQTAGWVTAVGSLSFLAAGTALGYLAQSRADAASIQLRFIEKSGQPHVYEGAAKQDFLELQHQGQLYNGLAIGFLSVAAVGAAVTTTLFVIDYQRRAKQREVRPPVVGLR